MFVLFAIGGFLVENTELPHTLIIFIVLAPFFLFCFAVFLIPSYRKAADMIRNNTTIPEVFIPIVTIFSMIAFFVVAILALLLVIITAGLLLGALQSFFRGFLGTDKSSK
jgi:hypothetical protein